MRFSFPLRPGKEAGRVKLIGIGINGFVSTHSSEKRETIRHGEYLTDSWDLFNLPNISDHHTAFRDEHAVVHLHNRYISLL